MNRVFRLLSLTTLAALLSLGCEGEGSSNLTVERLPDVVPNLPAVPTLPPPPHPTTYDDGSYSVYGARRRARITMGTDLHVTGYIVAIYEPPGCPGPEACPPPAAPHIYIADTPDATDRRERMLVGGYAERQSQIDDAIRMARRGRAQQVDEEFGEVPIPTDFEVGNKIKVSGSFTQASSMGFRDSLGLIDYRGHETL